MKNFFIVLFSLFFTNLYCQNLTTFAEYSPKAVFNVVDDYSFAQYAKIGFTKWHNPQRDFWMSGFGASIGYLDFVDYKTDALIRTNIIGTHLSLSDEDTWWGSLFVDYAWSHRNLIVGAKGQLTLLENVPVKDCEIIFGLEMAYMVEFKRNIFGPQLGFIYEIN